MKKLVIVESPSKSKTIQKYLGSDYTVTSSVGHVMDLATTGKEGLGVDVEHDFEPNYKISRGKAKVVKELKKEAKGKEILLATDPDREGEAISWHLATLLELDLNAHNRVVFNEVTKDSVLDALNHPRQIDMGLVKSQETRRILDRIIGFKLSKLLKNKINSTSAGRVQSVALKLVVERQREIDAFIPEEYWNINAKYTVEGYDLVADLIKYKGKKIEMANEQEALEHATQMTEPLVVSDVATKKVKSKSKLPFITSTLQQEASSKLNFSPKKTMSVAQKLYEGFDLKEETVGLITYMRTDSYRLNNDFVEQALSKIEADYGKKYVGTYRTPKQSKNAQDAHEAIRPTTLKYTPESIKGELSNDEYKLYHLIYYRTIASLMADAQKLSTNIKLQINDYLFQTTGSMIAFDGYLSVYGQYEKNKDEILPKITQNDVINEYKIEKTQHFTKGPSAYNEASLVKAMEELGIGRPSTYAQTIETLKTRFYVEVQDKKFIPTKQGILTVEKLDEYFNRIINVDYTANMENELDLIAHGEIDGVEALREFYHQFDPMVKEAYDKMEKLGPEKTGELCPECSHELVVRQSRFGRFVACSNYPECKYIQKKPVEQIEGIVCPKCQEGKIIGKKTKRGRMFYGCSRYPDCNAAYWQKPIDQKCPDCQAVLLEDAKGNIKCSECSYKKSQD